MNFIRYVNIKTRVINAYKGRKNATASSKS